MSRSTSSVPAARKSTTTKKAAEKAPVNPVAPGTPVAVSATTPDLVTLKVIESEGAAPKEVVIDKNKRLTDHAEGNEALERLGLIKALDGVFDHDVDLLKAIAYAAGAKYVESDTMVAQVIPGGAGGSINVQKFWEMCSTLRIPVAKRLEVMSVGKDPKKLSFLSADQINKLLEYPAVPPQPRLTVERKKNVAAPAAKDAIDKLAKQVKAGKIGDWAPKPKKRRGGDEE